MDRAGARHGQHQLAVDASLTGTQRRPVAESGALARSRWRYEQRSKVLRTLPAGGSVQRLRLARQSTVGKLSAIRAKTVCGAPFCPNIGVHEGLCAEHRRVRGRPWQRLRAHAIERAGHRCELCGEADVPLEVHHAPPLTSGDGARPPRVGSAPTSAERERNARTSH